MTAPRFTSCVRNHTPIKSAADVGHPNEYEKDD